MKEKQITIFHNNIYIMYGYANSSTATPAGFTASFSAQRTVLVVAATVDGKLCYYPVTLSKSTSAHRP